MRNVVVDIETCAYPFKSLSESQQEYIVRYAEKEKDETLKKEMINDAIRFTSLYPLTAKVIVIGIYDVEKGKSFIYYESEKEEEWVSEDNPGSSRTSFKGLSEVEMLKSFWRIVEVCDKVITFNGRNFDIPFLMIRSAMNKIKPTKNLLGNRYDQTQHIDLLEQFTFYGLTKKFNLDFYCNSFEVKSPKSKEVSGMEVKNLYEAGKIKDIAIYCGNDIYATYQLYKIWDEYLNI